MGDRAKERRNFKRRHIVFYLDIFEKESGLLLGQLGDLSTEGLLILAKSTLPLNEIHDIRISLPDVHGFSHEWIEATIETRWSSPDVNPDLFCTGAIFTKLDEGNKHAVQYLINVLGFND